MTDKQILENVQKYFNIKEFVDGATFKRHGNRAWQFMDMRLLHTMFIIREAIGKPITINVGTSQQRGLRTNICRIVKKKTLEGKLYLSAHTMGKAVDFDVKGMKAEEVRDWIIEHQSILPYNIRLEHKMFNDKANKKIPISWVHLDVYYLDTNPKVYLFDV